MTRTTAPPTRERVRPGALLRAADVWRRLTEPAPFVEALDQRRQMRLLASLLLGLTSVGLLAQVLYLSLQPPGTLLSSLEPIPFVALLLLAYWLCRTRYYRLAPGLAIVTLTSAIFASVLDQPTSVQGGFLDFLILPLLFASAFVTTRNLILFLAALLGAILSIRWWIPSLDWADILVGPATFVVLTGFVIVLLTRHRDLLERDRQAELAEKEQRYRTLVEQVPAITYLDVVEPDRPAELRSVYLSPQFEQWLGYSIIDHQQNRAHWHQHVHPDDRERIVAEEHRRDGLQGDSVQEYRLLTRDGRVLWVRDSARVRWDQATHSRLRQGILLDMTDAKQMEGRIRREAARSASLLRVAARLNAQLDVDTLLSVICAEISQALGVPLASVSLHDERRDVLYLAAATGFSGPRLGQASPIPRRLFDQAVERLGPVIVLPDVRGVPDVPGAEFFAEMGVRSVSIAPIQYESRLIGSLNGMTVSLNHDFDEDERMLLQGLADQAALAIINTRLYKDAQRRLERLQALRLIDVAITSNQAVHQTLDMLLDQITRQLAVDAAVILLLDAQGQVLEYAAGRGFRTQALLYTRLRLGESYAGQAALGRQVVSLPELPQEPGAFANAPLLAHEAFVAYFAAPLVVKDQVKGVVEVFHRSPLHPDAEWMAFLEALAGQAAIAIDNSGMLQELQRSNAELSEAYEATIEGWSRALDLRDKETEGHTQRVTQLSVRLARDLAVPEAEIVHIRRGALLHDIGKMGVPDRILLKPGPLDETEWEMMHRHPQYAYEMLLPIQYLRPALDIPYCHHERWDGTGYPRGLKGQQIPLAARLFAVVDVWDALRSDRPYRLAWPLDQVREHIRSLAGSHFDPRVAEVFLELVANEAELR